MGSSQENRIKSAFEIAMEKAARLGSLKPEEAQELKWVPEGKRIAALYLNGEAELLKALDSLESSVVPQVLKGMLEVLLANLNLPRNEASAATNRKVLAALRGLCRDGKAADAILSRVSHLLDQYTGFGKQQLAQASQELKRQVAAQVSQQLQKQGVRGQVQVDIESLPEYQAQWRAVVAQFDQQYEQPFREIREQLRQLIMAKPHLPQARSQ